MPNTYYAALDLGADSGRVILGHLEDGRVCLEEIHRFRNGPQWVDGHFYWNIQAIYTELKAGLAKAGREGRKIASLSVDSWGVDYILYNSRVPQLGLPFNYRDSRTDKPYQEVREALGDELIYQETGIQFLPFNTIYQLAAAKAQTPELLEVADRFLPVADYLNYLFCGVERCEVSMASTTQLYNPVTRQWSKTLIERLELPREIFPEICDSGTVLGKLRPEIAEELGLDADVSVVATCSHDTGAAVAACPISGSNSAYLSSGTWSLMGAELADPCITEDGRRAGFTNEIGYGNSVRFLKNLIGMWILQECKREWAKAGDDYDYKTLDAMAAESEPVRSLIHPNAGRFLTPGGMLEKVRSYCRETGQPEPETPAQIVRCILESLALLYRGTLQDLATVTGQPIEKLHIVGGGSNSSLLNQWAANAAGIPVHAGPMEATAAGNLLIQALARGELTSLQEVREVVRNSFTIHEFQPDPDSPLATKGWDNFTKLDLLD